MTDCFEMGVTIFLCHLKLSSSYVTRILKIGYERQKTPSNGYFAGKFQMDELSNCRTLTLVKKNCQFHHIFVNIEVSYSNYPFTGKMYDWCKNTSDIGVKWSYNIDTLRDKISFTQIIIVKTIQLLWQFFHICAQKSVHNWSVG